MPSKLLAECIDQLEHHGIGSPEFRDYFLSKKSRLLSNIDIACDLVVLAVQDDDPSGNAVQLLSLLLDEARMGLENDSAYAEDFLETVEMAVQAGLAAGAVKQRNLMELAGLYRQVGLTVPQSLMLDPDNMAPQPDMENFDLSENLEGIARDMLADGGSPYDLFNAIDAMLAAVPEKIQAGLAHHLATMDAPFFERCALFMLLAGSDLVQQATIAGLHERLDTSAIAAETLTLLPIMRGWFADAALKAGLDDLITKARRKAVPVQTDTADADIQAIVASVTDGVGAQSISVQLRQGEDFFVALLLIKAGHGIKDAFLVPPEDSTSAENLIAQLRAETGAGDISADTLRVLLEGALADGLENHRLPAPGFLDVIEACSLLDLRPQELSLEKLLNLADPERKILDASPQALGRWINDSLALDQLEDLTASWFEDTEESRDAIATGRTARSIETKIWKLLESRRELWARRFLQTAVMLRDAGRLREWKTLTASAYGLMSGRALKRIPLMEDIMTITIEADDAWMW